MAKTFTPNDLLQYIYGELELSKKVAIEMALQSDPILANEFEQLSQMRIMVDKVKLAPSERSVNRILEYSKNLNIEPVAHE